MRFIALLLASVLAIVAIVICIVPALIVIGVFGVLYAVLTFLDRQGVHL